MLPRLALGASVALLAAGCAKTNADWVADLRDPEPFARVMAVVALGRSADAAAVPVLVAALDDDSPQVDAAAGDALRQLGEVAVRPLLDTLRRDSGAGVAARERALATLPTLGADAVPQLVEALRDGERYDGESIVTVLGRIGAPAVPALVSLLQSRDAVLATQASQALAAAGPAAAAALDALANALGRDEPALRLAVARAIKAVGPTHPAALAALVRDSHDADSAVQQAVLQGAVAGLMQLLRSDSTLQSHAAELQLRDLGAAAVPALCTALKEADADAIDAPARCLAALGTQVVRPVLGAFNERNPYHVERVGRVMALLGESALPVLLTVISEKENGERVMAASVVGALGPAATSAMPVLLGLLDEPPSSLIRLGAAYSLGRLVPPDDATLDRLLDVAAHDNAIVRQTIMPGVVNGLLRQLMLHAADPPPRERWTLRAGQLRALGSEALATLRDAARGADRELAATARVALAVQPGADAGEVAGKTAAQSAVPATPQSAAPTGPQRAAPAAAPPR